MRNNLLVFIVLLSGCSLDFEQVKTREAACKAENGTVSRAVSQRNGGVYGIYCTIDGIRYWVAPSGKLK